MLETTLFILAPNEIVPKYSSVKNHFFFFYKMLYWYIVIYQREYFTNICNDMDAFQNINADWQQTYAEYIRYDSIYMNF